MSCGKWRDMAALDAGGDLSADESAALHRHLEQCPECREFGMEIASCREAIMSLRTEDFLASEYDAVRAAVHGRIAAPRWPWFAWAAAAAIVGMVAAGAWDRLRVEEIQRPRWEVASAQSAVRALPSIPPVFRKPLPHGHGSETHARHRNDLLSRDREGAVVVKFETGDPQIVVYWLVDRKGE